MEIKCKRCNCDFKRLNNAQKYCKKCIKIHLIEYNKNYCDIYFKKPENIRRKKEYDKEYLQREVTQIRLKKYNNKPKVKKYKRDYANKYRLIFPKIIIAQHKAQYNIKIPKNYLCEICNKNIAADRHHSDYSMPLKVKLLCKNCHIGLHNEKKKEKAKKQVSLSSSA